MGYVTPPVMSASTLLGATQLNIISQDLIDIEGRCKAPNVPFERYGTGDHGAGITELEYHVIHKYVTSTSEHLGLEYAIDVTNQGGGTGAVSTCMVVDGTTACTFSVPSGACTFRGIKDLAFLDNVDGVDYTIGFQINDSACGNVNSTVIRYLGEIKDWNNTYDSFRAARFNDGDTADVTGDLARLRANIIALNAAAKRGTMGFRARSVENMDDSAGEQTLFDGYLKSIKTGRLYMLFAYGHNTNDAGHIFLKTTMGGEALATITACPGGYVAFESPTISACTLDCSSSAYAMNAEVRVTVSACCDTTEGNGTGLAKLMYLAEVPGGSIQNWYTPGNYEHGDYVEGTTGCINEKLSTAASNVEHLAGDWGGSGYGTDDQSTTLPVGRARAVYRFPVHLAGVQHLTGHLYTVRSSADGSESAQQIYAIHSGETGYYRGRNCTLKYPAASASPDTQSITDWTNAVGYDNVDMQSISGLAVGQVYFTESIVDITVASVANDYIEERFA